MLPSSTNPTRPYTVNTLAEHMDMLMVCHHLEPEDRRGCAPSPKAASGARPSRRKMCCTILAPFSMIVLGAASAMGRVGEVLIRTWQTADKMKRQRGARLPRKPANNDNFRAKRYIAKYTINPAIAQGISKHVGSIPKRQTRRSGAVEPGFFRRQAGSDPERRQYRLCPDGRSQRFHSDAAAGALPPDVRRVRPCRGIVLGDLCRAASPLRTGWRNGRSAWRVRWCRSINTRGEISKRSTDPQCGAAEGWRIDPETYEVRADGMLLTCEPATVLPMAQRYFLF